MAAILFCVGYAVFATRYIGSSKSRREIQDSRIKDQLKRTSTVSVSADRAGGAQHEGRGLKADAYAPRIPPRDHSSLHLTKAAERKHTELERDAFGGDTGSYDDLVGRDRARTAGSGQQAGSSGTRAQGSAQHQHAQQHGAIETGRDDLQVRAPHVAPVDHHIGQQHQHQTTTDPQTQYQQPQPHPNQRHKAQQQEHTQQHPQQQHAVHSSPVVAGPVEADRDAELRRQAAVTAPSLAVGSRIEADSHTDDLGARGVAEPGAVPVGAREPASERPGGASGGVTAPNIIPVSHLEPDSHQAQQAPAVHQPIISSVPHETDSSTHTGLQHRAPEDVPRAPDSTATTTAPVTVTVPTITAPSPVVAAPTITAPSPVVAAPTITAPSPVPEPVVTAPVRAPHADTAPQRNPLAKGLYALDAVDIDGKVRPLSEFAGKVTMVVNVASACGYTDKNYKGLMKVYEKYRPHGLEILGFPCNQFGSQESGTEAEIKSFCSAHYHVNFPMFSKVDVNGPHTHPVYQFLKRELPEWEGGGGGKGPGSDLVWNFQKIFVDHEGRPVKRLYQAWDQNAVESEVYRLLREARQAGAGTS